MENLVIIWSWPAGHTAAIYAARANLQPLMFEWFMAGGVAAGWQLTTTTTIENFPGFPDGIDGNQLMSNMRQQSINAWTRIQTKSVSKVDFSNQPFKIVVGQETIEAKAVIIATWATAKRMDITWEKEFRQKGISACAICDGGLPMFRDQHIAIVGWWDVAMEEALHLTHFAQKVTIIVRKDVLRASKAMQEKVLQHPKINILRNTQVQEARWDNFLEKILILDTKTNTTSEMECKGLFYAIGHKPNTDFLDWQISLDENGYIITYGRLCDDAISWRTVLTPEQEKKFKDGKKRYQTCTSVSGIFAAGDVADKKYRQAITSAGSGCMAALEAEQFLNEN